MNFPFGRRRQSLNFISTNALPVMKTAETDIEEIFRLGEQSNDHLTQVSGSPKMSKTYLSCEQNIHDSQDFKLCNEQIESMNTGNQKKKYNKFNSNLLKSVSEAVLIHDIEKKNLDFEDICSEIETQENIGENNKENTMAGIKKGPIDITDLLDSSGCTDKCTFTTTNKNDKGSSNLLKYVNKKKGHNLTSSKSLPGLFSKSSSRILDRPKVVEIKEDEMDGSRVLLPDTHQVDFQQLLDVSAMKYDPLEKELWVQEQERDIQTFIDNHVLINSKSVRTLSSSHPNLSTPLLEHKKLSNERSNFSLSLQQLSEPKNSNNQMITSMNHFIRHDYQRVSFTENIGETSYSILPIKQISHLDTFIFTNYDFEYVSNVIESEKKLKERSNLVKLFFEDNDIEIFLKQQNTDIADIFKVSDDKNYHDEEDEKNFILVIEDVNSQCFPDIDEVCANREIHEKKN